MRLQWSIAEIVGSYRRSGEDKDQIKIIAECNGCDIETIKNILREQGFEIKERKRMAKRVNTTEKTADMVKAEGIKAAEEVKETRIEVPEIVKEAMTEKLMQITDTIDDLSHQAAEIKKFMDSCK